MVWLPDEINLSMSLLFLGPTTLTPRARLIFRIWYCCIADGKYSYYYDFNSLRCTLCGIRPMSL